MPFTNDGYKPYTKDELYNALRDRFENEFDVDVESGYLVSELLKAEASVLAEYQEQMAKRLYDSAFVKLASGKQLTMKAEEAGIVRKESTTATGVVIFKSGNPVTNDRTIPKGTIVKTNEIEPVKYKTIEESVIKYIDGFESELSTGYEGNTTEFDIVSMHPQTGVGELQCGATNGASIINKDVVASSGTHITGHTYLELNTVSITKFGVQDSSNYYQIIVDSNSNIVSVETIVSGTVESSTQITTNVPTDEYLTINIDWKLDGSFDVKIKNEIGSLIASIHTDETQFTSGYIGFESGDSVGNKYWDEFSTSSVAVTIESVDTGSEVNKPSGSVTIIPNTISYIESVSNPNPVGDSKYVTTNGKNQRPGIDKESDSELKKRVFDSLSGGGQATRGAIYTSVSNIEDVISLTTITNPEPIDNTSSGGLPPYSSEIVVLGGSTEEIVETLYDTMSFVDFLRLHAGSHGIEETHEVYDNVTEEYFTGRISRPPELTVEVHVDLVYDKSKYAGKDAVMDSIVEYIGGTNTKEESVIGLGVGDNVYESKIQIAINNIPGVIGIQNLVLDITGDGTDDTTTDLNGLKIIDVPENEVAQVNSLADEIVISEQEIQG